MSTVLSDTKYHVDDLIVMILVGMLKNTTTGTGAYPFTIGIINNYTPLFALMSFAFWIR